VYILLIWPPIIPAIFDPITLIVITHYRAWLVYYLHCFHCYYNDITTICAYARQTTAIQGYYFG